MNDKKAWVTLATNDTYCLGALVLAHSLKKVNTKYDVVVLITSNVTFPMRNALRSQFTEVKEVDLLNSGDVENLRLLARPELGVTFTKLHCWRLTQYQKCVFLDADTLVLQNCDELFDREELSAAPDVGWPDCFNSGVFVFKPSNETYKTIINFALSHGSFDGGDQGLLNMFFNTWATDDSSKRLPFLYNLSSAAIYSYLPAFKWFGKGVKIVHFIGNSKPWLQAFDSVTRTVSTDSNVTHLSNFLQYWWDLFCGDVHCQLVPEMGGLAATFSQLKFDETTPQQLAAADAQRRQNWEQGKIDFTGRDAFDNILSKINETINKQSESGSDATAKASKVASSESPSADKAESNESELQEILAPCPRIQESAIISPETDSRFQTAAAPPTQQESLATPPKESNRPSECSRLPAASATLSTEKGSETKVSEKSRETCPIPPPRSTKKSETKASEKSAESHPIPSPPHVKTMESKALEKPEESRPIPPPLATKDVSESIASVKSAESRPLPSSPHIKTTETKASEKPAESRPLTPPHRTKDASESISSEKSAESCPLPVTSPISSGKEVDPHSKPSAASHLPKSSPPVRAATESRREPSGPKPSSQKKKK